MLFCIHAGILMFNEVQEKLQACPVLKLPSKTEIQKSSSKTNGLDSLFQFSCFLYEYILPLKEAREGPMAAKRIRKGLKKSHKQLPKQQFLFCHFRKRPKLLLLYCQHFFIASVFPCFIRRLSKVV